MELKELFYIKLLRIYSIQKHNSCMCVRVRARVCFWYGAWVMSTITPERELEHAGVNNEYFYFFVQKRCEFTIFVTDEHILLDIISSTYDVNNTDAMTWNPINNNSNFIEKL